MRLGDKVATMARRGAPLPYDAEVEWIGGTGTQFIDTQISFSALPCEAEFEVFDDQSSSSIDIFGAQNTGTGILNITRDSTFNPRFLSPNHIVGSGFVPNKWQTIKMTVSANSLGTMTVDGTVAVSANAGNVGTTYTQTIPGRRRLGRNLSFRKLKMYDGGVLVFDSFSVRFTNSLGVSEGAMYDKVSKQLFRNAGTGAFIVGPDKSAANGGGLNA